MKPRILVLLAAMVGSSSSTFAYAQTPTDAPHAEPSPTAPPLTTAEAPPPTPPAAPAQDQAATPATPPVGPRKARPQSPPQLDPRWMATPAPMWWGSPFERPQTPVERWYGWQTIVATVATDVVAVASIVNKKFEPAIIAISAHMIAGPIVHWAHGHVGRGFGVLGLNLGFTAVGLVSGIFFPRNTSPIPAFMGFVAGPALDIALFSTEIVKEPMSATATRSPSGVTFGVLPMVDSTRRGLLLTGQF